MENSNEIWQTSINGEVYDTDFAGLVGWISDGSLLPQDKVRKGNLRWIEANKVPALHRFFNAKQFDEANQVVTSTNFQNPAPPPQAQTFSTPQLQNFQTPPPPTFYKDLTPEADRKFCVIHTDANAKYHCQTCGNYFCKACPQANACPMCGAACKAIDVPVAPPPFVHQPVPQSNQTTEVFIDDDVRKASNWFFWKAGLSVVNSILLMAGVYWQFFLGSTFPQVLHGFMLGLTGREDILDKGDLTASPFNGVILVISLLIAGAVGFIGYQARQAKKWAFVLGIIIFSFDALLDLAVFWFIGAIIHGVAIYLLCKGYSACNNK